MEIKKIVEGMTAPEVAQVIDDNFIGVTESLENISSKIENIGPITGVDAGNVSIFNSDSRTEWTNEWIDDDGSGRQISPSARAYFFKVKGIKKLHLSLSQLGGNKSYYHYVFFNSEKPGTSSIMVEYSAKENSSEFVGDVEVPENAVLIGVNVDLGYDNDVAICDYGYILEQSVKTADDVQQMEEDLSFFAYNKRLEWINSWIGGDGEEIQVNPTARAYFYKVNSGDIIRLSLSGITGQDGKDYYHYAFYNSDQPSASSLMADYSYIRERYKDLNTTMEVPEGAVLIGISVWADLPNRISFGKLGDKMESLTELQIKMEDVSDMLTKPLDMDLSAFGVLGNGQGITEEEARGAFLGCYCPVDIKTKYIEIDGNQTISFNATSDAYYGKTPKIDYGKEGGAVYPIIDNNNEIVGFIIIDGSKIVRNSYGTKYVYLTGNKSEYEAFRASYNSVTHIALWGDSLTALGSGYANFFDVYGCGRMEMGIGGEKPTQIMGRMGVAPFRLKNDITIPANTTSVNLELVSSFDDKDTYPRSNRGLEVCSIGGIVGRIAVTTAGEAVTFTRATAGEAVTVKAGTDVIPSIYGRNDVFDVIWMGQNGYGSADELVEAFKLSVANRANNYFLVLTPHLNTSDELEQKMQRIFGFRYINMRRWCVLFGLSESGIQPTDADAEAIANNQCPPSLLGDGVHFVESARQAIAKMIGDKVSAIIKR